MLSNLIFEHPAAIQAINRRVGPQAGRDHLGKIENDARVFLNSRVGRSASFVLPARQIGVIVRAAAVEPRRARES